MLEKLHSFHKLRLTSFIFNLWFLHKLKHKVCLFKVCVVFSIFDFVSFLLLFWQIYNSF